MEGEGHKNGRTGALSIRRALIMQFSILLVHLAVFLVVVLTESQASKCTNKQIDKQTNRKTNIILALCMFVRFVLKLLYSHSVFMY